jgi:hypothetical protein
MCLAALTTIQAADDEEEQDLLVAFVMIVTHKIVQLFFGMKQDQQ